jgi:hypothetical protein
MKLSSSEKWWSRGLSAASLFGVSVAAFVQTSHAVAAIFIFAVALLTCVAGVWIGARLWIKHRTLFACVTALLIVGACGLWARSENHKAGGGGENPALPIATAPASVQQNVSGAGSAAVNGNGNTVNPNPPPAPRKEEKK